MGFKGGGAGKDKLASHDVGKLWGGQSPTIHHFQGPWFVRRHEKAQGYRGLAGLGKEAFQA
jgi:hypothetical protein